MKLNCARLVSNHSVDLMHQLGHLEGFRYDLQ
jgi:hypothetical protein